jgi:hypothetical protein
MGEETPVTVVNEHPPILDLLVAAGFHPSPNTVFTVGDVVYNPGGGELPDDLLVHERVHTRQQAAVGGPEAWWDRYITDPAFMLDQEARAYGRQFAFLCRRVKDRNAQLHTLRHLAEILAGPIYAHPVAIERAMALIKAFAI